MKYLWTEDTGAGLHFWKLVNQLFFDDALVVESKESNQGLLDALADIDMKEDDKYYIAWREAKRRVQKKVKVFRISQRHMKICRNMQLLNLKQKGI